MNRIPTAEEALKEIGDALGGMVAYIHDTAQRKADETGAVVRMPFGTVVIEAQPTDKRGVNEHQETYRHGEVERGDF